MKLEDKMLLIKDLSARLPYAVTVEHTSGFRGTLHDIVIHHKYDENSNGGNDDVRRFCFLYFCSLVRSLPVWNGLTLSYSF